MFTFYSSFYEMQTREPTLGVQSSAVFKCRSEQQMQSCRRAVTPFYPFFLLFFFFFFFFFFLFPPPDMTGACCFHRNFWLDYLSSKFIFFGTCYRPPSVYTIKPPSASSKERLLGFETLPHSPLGWQERVSPLLLNALVFFPLLLFSFFLFFFFFFFFFSFFSSMIFFWCISRSQDLKEQQRRPFSSSGKPWASLTSVPLKDRGAKSQL